MPVKNKMQLCKYAGTLILGIGVGISLNKHRIKKSEKVGTIWIGKNDPEEMVFTPNRGVSELKKCKHAMIDIKVFDN